MRLVIASEHQQRDVLGGHINKACKFPGLSRLKLPAVKVLISNARSRSGNWHRSPITMIPVPDSGKKIS
jgi:hypothetical protein